VFYISISKIWKESERVVENRRGEKKWSVDHNILTIKNVDFNIKKFVLEKGGFNRGSILFEHVVTSRSEHVIVLFLVLRFFFWACNDFIEVFMIFLVKKNWKLDFKVLKLESWRSPKVVRKWIRRRYTICYIYNWGRWYAIHPLKKNFNCVDLAFQTYMHLSFFSGLAFLVFFLDISLFYFLLSFDKKISLDQFIKIIFKQLFNYTIVLKKNVLFLWWYYQLLYE